MGQRFGYGLVTILILVMLFRLDVAIAVLFPFEGALGDLLERGSVVPLLFLVVVSCGAWELRHLLQLTGAKPHALFAHLMIAVLVLTPWLSAAGWLGSGPAAVEGLYWQVVWLIVAGVGTAALLVVRRRADGAFRDVGATAILVFYLGFLSSFGLQLRCGRDVPGQEGARLLLMTLLVIKASDIGAYCVGSVLGRHPLAPGLSPSKSIEGAIGGLVLGVAVAVLFASLDSWAASLGLAPDLRSADGHVVPLFNMRDRSALMTPSFRAAVFGVAMSVVGQIGDLLESCFKRDASIKDSGKIIPRFGGILDLIDSPVLAMPVAWFLLTVVWGVV